MSNAQSHGPGPSTLEKSASSAGRRRRIKTGQRGVGSGEDYVSDLALRIASAARPRRSGAGAFAGGGGGRSTANVDNSIARPADDATSTLRAQIAGEKKRKRTAAGDAALYHAGFQPPHQRSRSMEDRATLGQKLFGAMVTLESRPISEGGLSHYFLSEVFRRSQVPMHSQNLPTASAFIEELPPATEQLHDACCPICQEELTASDAASTTGTKQMPCKHAFHAACIVPWLQQTSTCPACRAQVETVCPKYNAQHQSKIIGNRTQPAHPSDLVRATHASSGSTTVQDPVTSSDAADTSHTPSNHELSLRVRQWPGMTSVGLSLICCRASRLSPILPSSNPPSSFLRHPVVTHILETSNSVYSVEESGGARARRWRASEEAGNVAIIIERRADFP